MPLLSRRLAGTALTLALVIAALWAAYLWMFHGWVASTGPATAAGDAARAWHRARSERFLLAAGVCAVLAALWATRRRWRRRPLPAG